MEVEESRIVLMKKFLSDLSDYNVSPSFDDNQVRSCAVGSYLVNPEDVEGEVLNWSLQYLEQRKCPSVLTLAISKCVAEQLKELVENENKFTFIVQNTGPEGSIDAACLHRETMKHLHDLCDHWREHPDELLKYTTDIKEDPYFTSVCTIKNVRRKMEDRYTIIHNLNLVCGLKDAPYHSYYGVFDGHAGTRAANYAAAHLHSNIAHHPAFLSDTELAIKEGFKITDTQILERSKKENTKSGCTVVCSFLNEKTLHVAWVGDSQAVLVREGVPYIITNPHKPDREDERQRIEDLNGYVVFIGTWRVNGTLAVSRALGDPEYKPYVCAEPDVVTIPLEGNEDFFVLACDGLWDRLNPSDVASAIYSHLVEHSPTDYEEAASRLVLQAKEHGSADNITAIVIFLKDPKELAANPKNPPPYSLQLNGSKVDSWCQGSWNGTHESDNSTSSQYDFPEDLKECAVKPNSLGDLSKPVGIDDLCPVKNFQFNPVTCEAGRSYETDESKNTCHSAVNNVMPETTAFSELPTPPIDELLASEQFGEQNKLIEIADSLTIESEGSEIKPSPAVTLADSGILEQDFPQVDKPTDFVAQNSNDDLSFVSSVNHKDELLSSDTAVEMASEIVNNAIELAVTQVMVRTSSQMSQHFDDSGLEESDLSPVSASPECDAKHANESQELISFSGEESAVLKSEVKSECLQNYQRDSEGYQNGIKQTDSSSETDAVKSNENTSSSHPSENIQCLSQLNYDNVDKLQDDTFNISVQENIKAYPHPPLDNLLDLNLAEEVELSKGSPDLLVPTMSTAVQQNTEKIPEEREAIPPLEKMNAASEILDSAAGNATQNPAHDDQLIQPLTDENTETSISSSLLRSDVGQLFEHLANEENKTLPAALSNSLSEELQSGVTPIDLVTIPDEVPEAEGVTEDADSDSEKDGGWSYIQGSKTDIPKQQKTDSAVSAGVSNVRVGLSNKKPLSKSIKKEPPKTVTEARTSQPKPNTLIRKKSVPEKNDKAPPGTLKVAKPPKATTIPDKAKKPSSAPSKSVSQVEKSVEITLRPKSSVTLNIRSSASRTNHVIGQKTAATNSAEQKVTSTTSSVKQQKPIERKVTSTSHVTSAVTSTVKTTTKIQKLAPRPAMPKIAPRPAMRVAARTGTSEVKQTGLAAQSKAHPLPTKLAASNKPAPKSVQDAKQTKESANKQISSQPSSVPKPRMPLSSRTLPSRDASKPATSKQATGPSKPPVPKTTKLPSTTKTTSVMNRVNPTSAAKSTTISRVAKEKQKPEEKPRGLTHQPSEQEKGTKEELTKEIVANENPVDGGSLNQENNNVFSVETRLENEAIPN